MADDPIAVNRSSWDRRTKEHVESRYYDVDGFLRGGTSLKSIELGLLGDVRGKSLLHLQCHFGLDTLSLERLGCVATGVDLSPEAIAQAERIRDRAGLTARFVCGNVFDVPEIVGEKFDLVFTSYGVIEWLPDLRRWASAIAASLHPGGRFRMVEFHPYRYAAQGFSYFHRDEPDHVTERTYTENASEALPIYVWSHPISDVLNALIEHGLEIERFDEYPFSPYWFEGLVERAPGQYHDDSTPIAVPMLFSVSARRR